MARSRPGARRVPPAASSSSETSSAASSGAPARPSLASATLPRVWQGVGYRPLPDAAAARPLFDFAAVPWPIAPTGAELAWGAFSSEGLIGAAFGERAGSALMLHGPVVNASNVSTAIEDPLEVAAQLVAAAMDHARALGVETVFTRPNGLDRLWVRFGFIPVPEAALPERLAGRPGAGLYAWRGDSALWSFRERRDSTPVTREDAPVTREDAPVTREDAPVARADAMRDDAPAGAPGL